MKKKIKEICSDCYGNNPLIQNEGFESYYNMLPKDNCGKCKDTPYPNPGQGNCCEEPDHSGIYTLGCIEGYGTKCDPLRIKENCLPSGNSDCECECECPSGEQQLICFKEVLEPICDYIIEDIVLREGSITVEFPETITFANNSTENIGKPPGGAMYESRIYVWVVNEGFRGHGVSDSPSGFTKFIYIGPKPVPSYTITRSDLLSQLLPSKLNELCDIQITSTGFVLSNPKIGNVLGVSFDYMAGPPGNFCNDILINSDNIFINQGCAYDTVYSEISTNNKTFEVEVDNEWIDFTKEIINNSWKRQNYFKKITKYRLLNIDLEEEKIETVSSTNCKNSDIVYPICDQLINVSGKCFTISFPEEFVYTELTQEELDNGYETGFGRFTIYSSYDFSSLIDITIFPNPKLTKNELIQLIENNFNGHGKYVLTTNENSITICDVLVNNIKNRNILITIDKAGIDLSSIVVENISQQSFTNNIYTWEFNGRLYDYTDTTKKIEVNYDGVWKDITYNVKDYNWSNKITSYGTILYRLLDENSNIIYEGESAQENCSFPISIDPEPYSICEKLTDHEIRITELEENGGGGEVSASNGIYNDEGTLKLGTNLTEDTDIPNPNNKFFRVGNPGDAINLNANIPIEFGDFALTYTGFDYVSGTHQSFSGILKGVTFAPLDMEDIDIVGTFTIAGDPFNVTTPDGQIFIDGIWYDEGEVVMNKIVLNFTTSGISLNINRHSKTEQFSYYEGNNGILNDYIKGENGAISRIINNPTTSKVFSENITDTKQEITVDNIKLNTTEYSLNSEGSKTGYTDSIIKIIGKNIADGIGIFLGNIWRNVFVKTGLVIFGGGSDYVNGFDIIGEGSSVGGGVTGKSLNSGTGLYLNGETNNSGLQFPGIRIRGKNTGTFDDIIIDPFNGKLSILNIPTRTQTFVYGEDVNGKLIKFNLTDYLPKTLVEFRGSASHTGTTSESVVYASPAIPSTAWRENGNYILTILGAVQAYSTQNAVIKIYLNTANTLNGSEILINQSHVLTDNTYTPNGGNVIAINLPIFKNTIELLTNKGNSTIANINTGSIFSSNINMTYAKIRTKVTPNFTGNLYLIITTTQSLGSVTTEINNIIFKEI